MADAVMIELQTELVLYYWQALHRPRHFAGSLTFFWNIRIFSNAY